MRLLHVAAALVVLIPWIAGADPKPRQSREQRVVADRVIAVVNEGVILESELSLRMTPLRAEAMQIADVNERDRRLQKLSRQTLDAMVDDELILQAGKAAKLSVEESEIDATIDYIMKEHKLTKEEVTQAMKEQGITRATLRDDLLRQRAVANFVAPKISVTEEDLKARYDQLSRRSATVSAVNVSQILFALPEKPTQQQQDEAKRRAQQAMEQIKDGASFASVATAVSDDASTKATGGMLGWLQPGTLDPVWETVVITMDKGDLRGPISGANGLYLLYANDVKRNQLDSYDKMKDQLTGQLRQQQLAKATKAWLEELHKKAYIEIKLT
jgi:parvulin-like peptidyl-prolyl isomerase